MADVHGRFTEIEVDTKDISPYCNTSNYEESAAFHDKTGYGAAARRKSGGLQDGKFTAGGTYDNTAGTGPRAVLQGKAGTTQALVRRVEGTGTGKPEDTFSAVLTKYAESNPVDGMVAWSAEWEIDGAVTTTTQV